MDSRHAIDLAYAVDGPLDGFPVVLLHGFPFAHGMWRAQARALSDAGYRAILPDLRGHGASPRAAPATMQAMAADVQRLLGTLAIDRCALVGFSMGGYVALQLARDVPQVVRGLALVDTRAGPDTEEARAKRYAQAEDVKTRGVGVVADAMLPKMLTGRTRASRPELAAEVYEMMTHAPQLGVVNALHGLAERPDQRPHLTSLRMPAIVLVGDEDEVAPVASAEVLVKGLPDARLEIVRGAAHLTPMEQPEVVNAALLRWLRALPE